MASLNDLSVAQLAYLQQSGILEGFHYALTHMAASGVYLHDRPAQLPQEAQQDEQQQQKKLAPSASAPSLLPAIGGKTQQGAHVAGSPTNAAAQHAKAKNMRTRDAYELLASHLDRFAVTWQQDERTSALLATLPSGSTAHPKRNPHAGREVPHLIAAQAALVSSQPEEKEDDAAAHKPVWSPEPKAQRKRDQKAFLASPPRVFSTSPTRDAHGRVANLFDGSDAVTSLEDAVRHESVPLHVLSPPKQKRALGQASAPTTPEATKPAQQAATPVAKTPAKTDALKPLPAASPKGAAAAPAAATPVKAAPAAAAAQATFNAAESPKSSARSQSGTAPPAAAAAAGTKTPSKK